MAASSAAAEYHFYSSALTVLEYVRLGLHDLHIFPNASSPPTMIVDSEPMSDFTEPMSDFTKALVRDYVQCGRTVMKNCLSTEQIALADIWT